MKNITFILAFFGVFFFSNQAIAQKLKATDTAVIKTKIFCDHCKQCESCGGRLEKAILKEKGIQMITLNEELMTITVVYNTKKTSIDTIKQAISKQGYDADDIKAEEVAYESLDGCCKK